MWKPQPGPQAQFLDSAADIVVYGGAAGGGKSFGLLLDAIRHIGVPDYGAVIFRRTRPQVTNQGGLWDTSQQIYPLIGAAPRVGDLSWTFKGGQKVRFAHLQHEDDKLEWQGAQVPYIGFDELTHFTESQFFYLLSRNRSVCGVRPCVRATCNPRPGWVKRFLAPWLDKGFPNPAASGEVRWFIRRNGEIEWVDEGYRDGEGHGPKSVTFIRSTIYDNEILLSKDPDYLVNLKSLPLVEQARLLHGDWDVFEGSFFDEWSESRHAIIPPFEPGDQPKHWDYFAGMDWGYSERAAFAFTLCATDEAGSVHVLAELKLTKKTNEDLADAVCGLLSKWGLKPSQVPIAADPSMWSPTRTKDGWNGEADIEAFIRRGLVCAKADNNRQAGWSQVRRYLHTDGALRVWKGHCPELIRLFPEMQYSSKPSAPNDMDTDGDDHLHDALRYALMTRPVPSGPDPSLPKPTVDYAQWWVEQQDKRRGTGSGGQFYA